MGRVAPSYQWYRHCEVLAAVLQRVADGEIKRLMIFMPPRHGKSYLASRLFSAYMVYRYPQRFVGLCSYGAQLAYTFSRSAREHYQRAGGVLQTDTRAVNYWLTGQGGGMWAAGVGGPIAGLGFSCGIIDDWDKNADEAASETIRAKKQEWYASTFYTREEPWSDTVAHSPIVLIGTRWNEGDLAGWQLANELSEDEEPECWHIVNLPAIAERESERQQFPPTCTVEPDWRAPGEALCPERRPLDKLKHIRARIGEYFWSALFGQRPAPAGGIIFHREWFRFYQSLPEIAEVWTLWDTALKAAESNAETASVVMALGANGNLYLLRVSHGRWETPDVARFLAAQAQWLLKVYGVRYKGDFVEDKVSGTTLMQYMRRTHPKLAIIGVSADADKVARAQGVTPIVEAGRVHLPDPNAYPDSAPSIKAFLDQVCLFPNAGLLDMTDAFVYSLKRFLGTLRTTGSRKGKAGGYIG